MQEEDNTPRQHEIAADGKGKLQKKQGHWKDSAQILTVTGALFSLILNSWYLPRVLSRY